MRTDPRSPTIHPFERAGLGVAPFAFVGVEKNWFCAYPGDPGKPGGSCDYCGTGIAYEYWVQDATGKRFKVGSDCAGKLARTDASIACPDRVLADIKHAAHRLAREQRWAREMVREGEAAAAVKALLADEAVVASLQSRPHPHAALADRWTAYDYVDWLLDHGQSRRALTFVRAKMEASCAKTA